ncbi:MAG: ATP-binding protein, partial [Alphaproteobacteria bacterium]|nr:ATP-binding protein [Alphaproteobacteria bacterium]
KFYKPHYDKFFNDAVKNVYQEPEMIYINKDHWIIASISLLCSEKPEIKQFLSSIFGIEGEIDKSEISVSLNLNAGNIDKFKQTDAVKFVRRLQAEEDLRVSHIASYEIGAKTNDEFCRKLYFYLYLLSLPIINEVNKVSKAIEGIDISINGYNIDSLSEGHKKLILIKFITSIIGTENSLILLDEPDAHTHIASKRDILASIQECPGQTILTTHSPVFIDMMDFENLRYVEYGGIVDMDRIKAITKIADGSISILEGALIAASKKIIITEGPDDVKHIKAAISALVNVDPKYSALFHIPIVFQGGAKLVEEYYKSVLEPVYDNLENVIFVFDYDSEGRDGVKLVNKLGKEKIKHLYYYDSYPIPENTHDFYLEDFYPRTVYPEIILPNINNEPSFYEMKKCGSLTKSVKDKLQKMIDRGELKGENFNGFSNFLNELIRIFDN